MGTALAFGTHSSTLPMSLSFHCGESRLRLQTSSASGAKQTNSNDCNYVQLGLLGSCSLDCGVISNNCLRFACYDMHVKCLIFQDIALKMRQHSDPPSSENVLTMVFI